MENASNALIMAASVLIGLVIISLAVYLFVSFGSTSAEIHEEKEQQTLNEFNAQFTSYEGKEGITIYDVVSVANLATESNRYYEFKRKPADGSDYYISVTLGSEPIEYGTDWTTDKITSAYNKLISENLQKMQYKQSDPEASDLIQYKCQVEISPTTGRVYKVIFTEKK